VFFVPFPTFGTTQRRERVGLVADLCPYCCDARLFTVWDLFLAKHVYASTIGRGSFVTRARQCHGCLRMLGFAPERYRGPWPESRGTPSSFDEVLTETNPILQRRMHEIRRLEVVARAVAEEARANGGDFRMVECVQWLGWLAGVTDNDAAIAQVAEWPTLGEDDRDAALANLRAAGAELRRLLTSDRRE
jgi:hypothetical protein